MSTPPPNQYQIGNHEPYIPNLIKSQYVGGNNLAECVEELYDLFNPSYEKHPHEPHREICEAKNHKRERRRQGKKKKGRNLATLTVNTDNQGAPLPSPKEAKPSHDNEVSINRGKKNEDFPHYRR